MVNSLCVVNDCRHSMNARVCACVGMFAGCTVGDVAYVMGLSVRRMRDIFPVLLRDGCIDQVIDGRSRRYHLRKNGRRLIASERARLDGEFLALLGRARECGGFPRLEVISRLEQDIIAGLKKPVKTKRVE